MIVVIVVAVVVTKKKKNDDNDSEGSLFNNGFFYPIDDMKNLHKCFLENCKECHGSTYDNICDKCFSNSTARYTNEIIIFECTPNSGHISNNCIEGAEEKCLKCDEYMFNCLKCNQGFFLPTDQKSNIECQKCPIKNCKQCTGLTSNPSCLECENYAIPDSEMEIKSCSAKIGEGPFCKTIDKINDYCASCNEGYKIENGKCILNYHFKAIFKTRTKNENVKLIEKYYYIVEEMIVDGKKLDKKVKSFNFENKGEHIVYYKVKLPENGSLIGMFEGLKKMTSISFSGLFDFSSVKNMNRMFYNCQNLKNIDLSGINTENIEMMEYMFYQNLELGSVNLSEIYSPNIKDVSNMFENCISIKNIDISNFNSANIETKDMFKGIPDSGTIIVNEKLKSEISSLLPKWNMIIN